jgi:NAD(P)-dependent dehydrogenase (short-subunit alcohol dehydrogenase family)
MEGVADGAAIECDVLLAAFTAPAAALGGCDVIAVSSQRPGVGVRGVVVGFGRVADPSIERFAEASRSGTLIGVKGLPGGVAGWNDSGLMVVLGRGDSSAASDNRGARPAALLIDRLVRECSTIDDVERVASGLAPIDQPIIVLHVGEGGVRRLNMDGRLVVLGEVVRECDPRAALTRILLADGALPELEAVASLLRGQSSDSLRAALSAAGAWLAVGVVDGEPHICGGSALGGGWLSPHEGVSLPRTQSPRRDETSSITRRYGLVTRALAQPLSVRDLTTARVVIIGGGVVAARLAASLKALGARPVLLPDGDHRQLCEALDREEAAGPIRHLVVATPWSKRSGSWVQRRNEAIIGPYFACQRWVMTRSKSGDLASSTMTAVTNLGGDFGLSGTIGGVESGALSGLFKGVAREFPELQVRVADFSPSAAIDEIASAVVGAIRDDAGPLEIGHRGGERCMIVPYEGGGQADPTASRASLTRGSVWLVTGGARGVTAACARELGSRYGLTLAVVGSTQPTHVEPTWLALDEAGLKDLRSGVMVAAKARGDDPRQAWKIVEKSIEIAKSMAAFQAVGVTARYYSCDLADAAAVRALVGRVVTDLGPVRGLVHGAGFEAACRFEKKTLEGLEATLGPKCIGFMNLLESLDKEPLERAVAFGSTSGRMGGHGQADYSLANDMLAKMAGDAKASSSSLRATVFHWHAWDEVGMASRPESRFVLEQFGLKFMPLAEGVRRFMDEIEAGQSDVEVLVTEPAVCPDAIPQGKIERSERPPQTEEVVTFDPSRDRFLLDHRLGGRPLLPAVVAAQTIFATGHALGFDAAEVELRDFVVHHPILFHNDAQRTVRLEKSPSSAHALHVRASTGLITLNGIEADREHVHFEGRVGKATSRPMPPAEEPLFPFYPMSYSDDAPLWHGTSFRTLLGVVFDRNGGWARLATPDPTIVANPRDVTNWQVPLALLDGCLVACGVYSYAMCRKRFEVPQQFELLRLVDQPRVDEECLLCFQLVAQDSAHTTFDLFLYGEDRRPLLELRGLRMALHTGAVSS